MNPALDVYKEAGGCETAYVQKFTAEADSEGKVIVTFSASVENAMVSYLRLTEPTTSITKLVLDAGTSDEDTSLFSQDTWVYGVPLDIAIDETTLPSWG